MKRIIFRFFAALIASSLTLMAVSPEPSEEVPVIANKASASAWHIWTASGGEQLRAKYKASENGIVTVEQEDRRTVRFPIARLSEEDQKFVQTCKSAQPRPPMAQGIITQAAARLDETIDAALKKGGIAANPPATDAQWMRRLYLDTIGRIPTELEARMFLSDPTPTRRTTLINALLLSPGYTMHMYNWFAEVLRVKDDYGKGARAFLYEDWLKEQIAMNVPWDVMVRDMLTADGKLNVNGASGFLLRDAQMPLDGVSNLLTTFLGANVSCAQCHDHPFAEWTQHDFYSMAAFFGATDGFHEDVFRKTRKLAKSTDLPLIGKAVVNQLLTSNAYNLVDLPSNHLKFPADYKYKDVKPGDPTVPELIRWPDTSKDNPSYNFTLTKPSQSRNQFADWMVHPDNPRFAAAIANRVWKKIFGLAVQEPVSDLDDPSAASNPELLGLITTYMKQAKFDLREFQRILLNTAAYQRLASQGPEDPKTWRFQGPVLRRMSAEQAWDSIVTLTSGTEADHYLLRRGDELQRTVVSDDQLNAETVKKLIDDFKERGAALKSGGGKKGGGNPRALATFYEGGMPQIRSGLLMARASELQQPAPENHFLRLFGQSDRLVSDTNTTDGSVPQMLQLMNGPVQEIITRGSTALAAAYRAKTQPDQVNSLYLSFLGRQPRAEESTKAITAMQGGLTISDLAWVLLNSREFLFIP
jgi:hypothetical protein